MSTRGGVRPLLALLGAGLCACAPPVAQAPLGGGPRPFDAASALRAGRSEPLPAAWAHAPLGPPPPTPEVDLLSALGASLSGVTLDEAYGAELVAALEDEAPEDVLAHGAGTFTLTELFGTGDFGGETGLCEDPHALYEFEEDGLDWEASLRLFGLLQLTEPPAAMFMSLSERCALGVDAAGGDPDAAVAAGECSEEEGQGFFPADGACRACVAEDTVEGCLDRGECKEETPQVYRYQGEWYAWAQATVLACAPDVTMKLYMAARSIADDGTIPESWNQTDWPWLCFGLRGEDSGEVERVCVADGDGYDDITDGYGDGVLGRIDYLREAGSDETPHPERVFYARSLAFTDGTRTAAMVLSFGGIGQISAPTVLTDHDEDGDLDDDDWGYGYGGWGMSPIALRPDGTDPTNVDHTYARDWLGGVVTKMATTRDGVPINNMNHSRCETWVGPHDDGSWTCTKNGEPEVGWYIDNHTFWFNRAATLIQAQPMMTLGSTGLPDPLVPGGFTPHLAGTADLANPDWDDCTWPHQFVPDHIRTEDIPLDWGGPTSLDAHTYKWGKDPDQDLRMVLATPQERGFCPEEE